MTSVHITGSSGFVGQNLLKYLDNKSFSLKTLSLSDAEAPYSIKESKNIVHLAGKAHDIKSVSKPEEYYKVNFNLTKSLYDEFLKSNAKKFIFISSVKASSDQVEGILTESDAPDPQTHYGKSKLMAEEYIQSQILPPGKSYFILRPCMIHGPGNKGNLNLLYNIISKGIPYPLAAFENRRSFLSIENLCFVIRELLERTDIPSGVYHVADDEPLSTNELISLIGKASNKSPVLWKVNPKLIRGLARLGNMFKLPLTTERLDKLTENYIVDNSKIKAALGKELPVRARDGIMTTILSFKNQAKH